MSHMHLSKRLLRGSFFLILSEESDFGPEAIVWLQYLFVQFWS